MKGSILYFLAGLYAASGSTEDLINAVQHLRALKRHDLARKFDSFFSDSMKKNNIDLLSRVLFAAIVCLLYLPVCCCGFWAINSSDGLHLHLPAAASIVTSFASGHYPLWEPLQNLGRPFSDGVNLIFHPANTLYFFYRHGRHIPLRYSLAYS